MEENLVKEIIKICEINRIRQGKVEIIELRERIHNPSIDRIIKELVDKGFLNKDLYPTIKGRGLIKVGLTGGVFDIIHPGHIETLKEAKRRVDLLAVIVARDKTVVKLKGRKPIYNEEARLKIISMIKPVDIALLGSEKDYLDPVKHIKPDIIFLGYDQELPPNIANRLPRNIKIEKLNIHVKEYKSSLILKRIRK